MAIQEFKFAPTEEFSWDKDVGNGETFRVATYYPGNVYNCTSQPRHDKLREMCIEWEEEGLIKVYPLPPGTKFVTTRTGG